MNWGKWIFAAFVFFAAFIVTLVVVCIRQDINLVSKDYYKDELLYQKQITRIQNANALEEKPEIVLAEGGLKVIYKRFPEIYNAKLELFRPSDASLDQQFTIEASSSASQYFEILKPIPGMYKARMRWEQQGKEYFVERIIIL